MHKITAVIGLLTLPFFISNAAAAAANDKFSDPHFSGSGNCATCHDNLTDNQNNDISIVKNWSTSMMANASRDPYWLAKVASELHRNPNLSDEINDKCSRCHTPMANEAAKKAGVAPEILGNGFLNPNNPYYDHALNGVSCTLCHQIADNGLLGTLEGVSGKYTIPESANPVDRPIYAQYLNPQTGPMRNNVQFTPQYSAHTSSSELCASCHDLKTPFVDGQGNMVSTTPESEFPEQMVYSEWKSSAYRTGGVKEENCQSCHMPQVEGSVKIANRPRNLPNRPNFSQHTFVGANTVMLDILDRNRSALSVTAIGFDRAIADARTLLQSSAELQLISAKIDNNQLNLSIKVINNSGHKLPTSYPSRRAFLHLVARDEQGTLLFESGRVNPNGSIVGNDMDINPSRYEPHYDLISSEDQVQIYEPVMQNSDGNVTHTLLRAAAYIKDNRLTPSGFDKMSVSNDVAVKGAAFDDANFNLGSDTLTYRIDLKQATSATIDVELNYQPLAYGHLQEMFSDSASLPEVATFQAYFEDPATLRSETLATLNATINNTLPTAADPINVIVSTSTPTPSPSPTANTETTVSSTSNKTQNGGSLSPLLLLFLSANLWLHRKRNGHLA
ncbi:MAG: multiheme c-type cytochrome [Gammaproteobacteria bacterium]|nr:multiheme c-type cytochrome [Gammaproteobacteria bacterium]